MAGPLTEPATPAELADLFQVIEITEIFGNFPRLAGIVEAEFSGLLLAGEVAKWRQYPVAIKLRCGWADTRRELVIVQGEVGGRMAARCQRCLEPFQYALQTQLSWLLVPSGVAVAENSDREIWELDDDRLRPVDIVEESLIMALPMAAKHADRKDCNAIASDDPEQRSDKVRPFANLKSQMQNLK